MLQSIFKHTGCLRVLKYFMFVCFLCAHQFLTSQIHFEKGYVITNRGLRTEGYIKNYDWKNNPSRVEFKHDSAGSAWYLTPDSIKEFEIFGTGKYVKAAVKIDVSGNISSELSHKKQPEWEDKTVFLKVVSEGSANLYYYEMGNMKRFFFSTDTLPVNQLVYKQYVDDGWVIHQNNYYLAQLRCYLKCGQTLGNDDVAYESSDLIKYFETYNRCKGNIVKNTQPSRENKFHITPFLGSGFATLRVDNTSLHAFFFDKSNVGFGFETESVFPFNHYMWSLVASPSFNYYHITSKLAGTYATYKSFDIPCVVRCYLVSVHDLSIYANIGAVLNYTVGSTYYTPAGTLDIQGRFNYAFGGGLRYKKYNLDILTNLSREVLSDYKTYTSNFSSLSFRLGYVIF